MLENPHAAAGNYNAQHHSTMKRAIVFSFFFAPALVLAQNPPLPATQQGAPLRVATAARRTG
ncbi:MAG TPA: hypothetical protein VIF83_13880, partial [Gemmatimonadaceae bacterium]